MTISKKQIAPLAGNEHVLTNLSLGLASESGEAIDLIKKYTFQGQDLDKVKLQHELGDVLWYLSDCFVGRH